MLKNKDFLEKTMSDLQALLKEKQVELGKNYFDLRTTGLKNNRSIYHLRKDIARINTALRAGIYKK